MMKQRREESNEKRVKRGSEEREGADWTEDELKERSRLEGGRVVNREPQEEGWTERGNTALETDDFFKGRDLRH